MNTALVELVSPTDDKETCEIKYELQDKVTFIVRSQHFGELFFEDDDLFGALVKFRLVLEKEGYRLLCNASRRDVYPSGMARDMGRGVVAYILEPGKQAREEDLVRVLDPASIDKIGTVAEQRKYYELFMLPTKMRLQARSLLIGVAVGDALGVPVEFINRSTLKRHPVEDMIGYGTHNMPPGTFSDDSSLTFCLAEALSSDYDIRKVANNFVKWLSKGYWTARREVFDVGQTTMAAIRRLQNGVDPVKAGGASISDNGNGSLMRILPAMFYVYDKTMKERYEIIRQISSLTHAHFYAVFACFYCIEFAIALSNYVDKYVAYKNLCDLPGLFKESVNSEVNNSDFLPFERLFLGNIGSLPESDIRSSGYVVDTLEASIWCILTTTSYKEAVLKAVNLGGDTDTTGAVVGGLAGLLYGEFDIPEEWKRLIARRRDIEDLAGRMIDGVIGGTH